MLPGRQELALRYAKLSNEKLIEITSNKQDYTPDALLAVEAEINKRQISVEEVNRFIGDRKAKQDILYKNIDTPLALWEKILFFMAWFTPGFIAIAINLNYSEDGYSRKLHQSKFYRIAGSISFFNMVILLLIFDLGNIATFALLATFFLLSIVIEKFTLSE
jgi:hypothetical protein